LKVNQATTLINDLAGKGIPFFVMTDFELQEIVVKPLDQLQDKILYDFKGKSNHVYSQQRTLTDQLELEAYPFDKYYHEFQQVHSELKYGNSFLINLTARHKIKTRLKLKQVFDQVQAKYKLYVNSNGQHFTCYSPETFVTIKDGLISSCPMKGTIDASIPNAKEILLADRKETAEHNTIVDLIRNDLSQYAKGVTVTKYKYLDLIKSREKDLYQMSSEIQGTLPENYQEQLGDIIFSMLPAGSISGAPKKKTVEIIKHAEALSRGYYTGICGLYDGENFDSCVMIRFMEEVAGRLYYRSGGGITFLSEVEKEYQEMVDKIYLPTVLIESPKA